MCDYIKKNIKNKDLAEDKLLLAYRNFAIDHNFKYYEIFNNFDKDEITKLDDNENRLKIELSYKGINETYVF